MKSFLQTAEWLEFQNSIGRKVWRFDDGKVVANIIRHDLPFGMNYLYIPHGPEIHLDQITGGLKNELQSFVAYIKNLAKEQKSIFIKIEPMYDSVIELLYGAGFRKSKKEIQPHKSIVLDLNRSEDEILAGMHHKTRYNIKVAEKYGVTVRKIEDIEVFLKLLQKTANRQGFATHPASYYRSMYEFFKTEGGTVQASLYVAEFEGKAIAGGLMLTYADVACYLHGGSDHEHRQIMAPYSFHWHVIREMKTQGFALYDFGGSEGDKYPGVTRFKLGWGGRQIEYPGAFDMSIRWFWFLMYKILRKIF
jgi:lipid II:glycine glycyltransferase (peptidoglycan interpeptide bridge formation enzyme)